MYIYANGMEERDDREARKAGELFMPRRLLSPTPLLASFG